MNLIEAKEVLNDGVKRSSPYREPVPSESIIAPFVVIAMESYIIDVLGRDFYNYLVETKNGAVSIYNPSERMGEVIRKAFNNDTKLEELWTKGGLRDWCGWCVAVVASTSIGTQEKQGGIVRSGGGSGEGGADREDERRLLQNWESGVEILGKKVKLYLKENIEEVSFVKYKQFINLTEENDEDLLLGSVGLLKLNLPSW